MSTKLNAEELAAKRFPRPNDLPDDESRGELIDHWNEMGLHNGYIAAIREVAQPIADQRDELLGVLQNAVDAWDDGDLDTAIISRMRTTIAKCTTP